MQNNGITYGCPSLDWHPNHEENELLLRKGIINVLHAHRPCPATHTHTRTHTHTQHQHHASHKHTSSPVCSRSPNDHGTAPRPLVPPCPHFVRTAQASTSSAPLLSQFPRLSASASALIDVLLLCCRRAFAPLATISTSVALFRSDTYKSFPASGSQAGQSIQFKSLHIKYSTFIPNFS